MIQTARRSLKAGAFALAVLALAGGAAQAQLRPQGPAEVGPQQAVPPAGADEVTDNKGINRRLDRDEQALRELRQIVLQAKASGAPVQVKDANTDAQLAAIQSKVDDFDQTLSRINGQIDTLQHQLDDAKKALDASTAANQDLILRVTKLEGVIQGMQMPAAAAQGGQMGGAPPQASADQGGGDQGGAGATDEAQAYRQARQVLDGGDYAGGVQALQAYLARYPTSPRAPEASYWLGRALGLQNMPADAAASYARALKGWPQSSWAGDAVVRLSSSLVDLKRTDDACAALGEFERRYAAKSSAAVKTRARTVRTQAACS
ncbi:MAG TPA: tol-pal system protein YbgF [Caulobacteraceae bacterium]|nr:tol-pal system protein YbgF [Caulobacteraceae bacterium]